MSIVYHPQIDDQTEKANRTIEDILKIFTLDEQDVCDTLLSLVEFLYNNLMNFLTKVTSFYLMYEKHLLTLSSFIRVGKSKKVLTKVKAINDFME